jgi:dimethylargininase
MSSRWLRRLLASVVTAVVLAVVVHFVNIYAWFLGNGLSQNVFSEINAYFYLASIGLAVLLIVFGWLGAFRRRWTAFVVSLVVAAVVALVNTMITALTGGSALSGTVIASILHSLFTLNATFVGLATIFGTTLGVVVYRWSEALFTRWGVPARVAVVRYPSSELEEGLVTHIERMPVDVELAQSQWDAYVGAFEQSGWTVRRVDAADELADAVFIEDALLVIDGVAIATRPGAESRRDEVEGAVETAKELGLETRAIVEPGTLEGGDVLVVGRTVYVGRSARTNAAGIRQLRALLVPRGFAVRTVPVTHVLHLKSAVTALPDGTVIGYPANVSAPELFDAFLPVPEPEGAAVVALNDTTLLLSAAAPKTKVLLEDLGYVVQSVDVSEFEKLEGCVTCLSVRVSR